MSELEAVADPPMTIAGEPVSAQHGFEVVNPATGAVVANAPDCDIDDLAAAMDAAQEAFVSWRSDEAPRQQSLNTAANVVEEHLAELSASLTAEQGKPAAQAQQEIGGCAAWLRYYAALERPEEVLQDDAAASVQIRRVPYGVVAAIVPWNFPVMLAIWKIAPALRAGNTMVLKPSPYTPLTTLKLAELLKDVFPAGVLNVVSGGDDLGAWMTSHPVPAKVSFTGSVGAGRKVAAACAERLRPATLELGGNDAAIVLEDSDLNAVATGIFGGAFLNAGQVCSAIKRVYVPRAQAAALGDALAALAAEAHVGDGADPVTTMGPLTNEMQRRRVVTLVDAARRDGASILTGGAAMDGPGYFYAPTIIADAQPGMALVDEEQFGPALPLIAYDDLDQAVAAANASQFGLSGSVWGHDLDAARVAAERLECGTAWVNTHLALSPHQPFASWKASGGGVENGVAGLHAFCAIQSSHVARVTA